MTMKRKPTTAAELIAARQEHPLDARVVVGGYEDGYDHALGVVGIALVGVETTGWWSGRLQDSDSTSLGSFHAVSLDSDRRRDKK